MNIDPRGLAQARRFSVAFCDDPKCTHIHVVLEDCEGRRFAVFTVDAATVKTLQNALYELATTKGGGE